MSDETAGSDGVGGAARPRRSLLEQVRHAIRRTLGELEIRASFNHLAVKRNVRKYRRAGR